MFYFDKVADEWTSSKICFMLPPMANVNTPTDVVPEVSMTNTKKELLEAYESARKLLKLKLVNFRNCSKQWE